MESCDGATGSKEANVVAIHCVMSAHMGPESPRVFRRLVSLSQADMADSSSC